MKLLAILKDSLREALDTKVLYVTVGLSLPVLLVLSSMYFRPVPVEEQLKRGTELMTWVSGLGSQGRGPRYDILEFQQTNAPTDPWNGNYEFLFVISLGTKEEAEEIGKAKIFSVDVLKQEF